MRAAYFLGFDPFYGKDREIFRGSHSSSTAFQVTLVVKNLPANAEDTRDADSVPGSERSPGVGNGAPFRVLACKILWAKEPGGLQSMGLQSQHD